MGGRGWEEDIYWTHFQFIHFTQFLRSDFHQQLALPKTFSDNIKKNLPESVTLKGPGGLLWNIELTTRDDTLYFTHGWQQFAKEHSLKENDFLVFKYNGESLFEVFIFDGESLCEKPACYFVRKTEQGGGCSSKTRDSDNSVEEVKTPNGVDEGVSPEKSLHLNSNAVPLEVPIETTKGKISNAGVESASAEQFMSDAVTDTEPKSVPSKTTGKRTRRPVYADTSVPSKKRGRPPKTDNSVKEVKTPNGVDEGVSPEKALHRNRIRVPLAVPIETTNGKTSNGCVESASAEQFMSDSVTGTEPKTVPSQTTGKRTRRPPKTVYDDTFVPRKERGRPPKTANSHKRALNCVSGAELSPKVSPKASPKGSGYQELYTSNRRPVTKNEIENTLQLAQATCAEDTLLVTMQPTHVYKRFFVSFPNSWILNHLSPSSQDVILRMGKSEWLGKYFYYNIRNSGGLTGGWKHFALENNLEEFDVCLFKPAGYMDKTLILDITIFRVVEEITPLTKVNSPGKKRPIMKTPTGVNFSGKKTSIKKTTTGVNSPGKKRSNKKTPAGVNSPRKKRSIKKTPTSAAQTDPKSFEPLAKKRGVDITLTSAVQTELDSIEGA